MKKNEQQIKRVPGLITCRRCGKILHDPVSQYLRLGGKCREILNDRYYTHEDEKKPNEN